MILKKVKIFNAMVLRYLFLCFFGLVSVVSIAQVDIKDELDLAFADVDKISELERSVKNWEGSTQALQKEKSKLQGLYENAKSRYGRLERDYYRLKVDLRIKEDQIKELEGKVQLRDDQLKILKEERDSLIREVNLLNQGIIRLEANIRALTEYFVEEINALHDYIQQNRLRNLKRANSVFIDGYNPIHDSKNIPRNPKSISFDLYYYPLPNSRIEPEEKIDMEVSIRKNNGEPFIVYPVTLHRNIKNNQSGGMDLLSEYVFYTNVNIARKFDFEGRLEKGIYYHVYLRCQDLEIDIGRFILD